MLFHLSDNPVSTVSLWKPNFPNVLSSKINKICLLFQLKEQKLLWSAPSDSYSFFALPIYLIFALATSFSIFSLFRRSGSVSIHTADASQTENEPIVEMIAAVIELTMFDEQIPIKMKRIPMIRSLMALTLLSLISRLFRRDSFSVNYKKAFISLSISGRVSERISTHIVSPSFRSST